MAELIAPGGGGRELRAPVPLSAAHDIGGFSSTREELNDWLKRHALTNEGKASRTYAVCAGMKVVGYYTLAAGSVIRGTLPRALRHGTPEQIPVVVLGRLATDRAYEGKGIGSGMLREAIARTLKAAEEIGIRALLVHAIDEKAVEFYLKYGFARSPLGERTLMLPVETARQALRDR